MCRASRHPEESDQRRDAPGTLLASHTTTEDIGRIAAIAKPKLLVLSHLVPGDDETITDEQWTADVKKHFAAR